MGRQRRQRYTHFAGKQDITVCIHGADTGSHCPCLELCSCSPAGLRPSLFSGLTSAGSLHKNSFSAGGVNCGQNKLVSACRIAHWQCLRREWDTCFGSKGRQHSKTCTGRDVFRSNQAKFKVSLLFLPWHENFSHCKAWNYTVNTSVEFFKK